MAETLWSQDLFSKGEISPLMYSRVSVNAYYNGLKTAKNVITFPQGAAGKRFGTVYLNEITGVTSYDQIYFESFQYLNECVYLIAILPDTINIYLEGTLVATVSSTGILSEDIRLIDHTILDNRFRVTTGVYRPKDLTRSASAANVITGAASNELSLTTPITNGIVLPARFTTSGTLPTTNPQIKTNRTYFVRATSTTTVKIYSSAPEAAADENAYTISSAGTGVNNVVVQNTWTFADVNFRSFPGYDFEGGYDAITFTPSATSGAAITITASSPIFTVLHVGGAYIGGGGVARITGFTSSTQVVAATVEPFDSTAAISGQLSFLTEPAWSDTRGWPRKCSSFQNRAFFANTELLPNGVWGSTINDFEDFNDLQTDDDNAISWFPTSDEVNYIKFITPYRSLTIQTNSGIYSTPLAADTAITPRNFSLALQDSTAVGNVQPRGIDNQIIVLSGSDAYSLIWDGINNAYTSSIVSVANEQVIKNPIDEAGFVDLRRAGSRYMFIVNDDGTLAIYQTLITEQVSGFTRATTEQPYGNGYFRWITSNFDGRCWFVTEREIAEAAAPVAISGSTATTFTATGVNFNATEPTACLFTTAGTLPTTSPQIEADVYYWAIGIDADTFSVYLTQADALANENPITITNIGASSSVEPWPLSTKFYIEEIDFDAYMDCCTFYDGAATSTLTGLSRFNAQAVLINGDGYGFEADVVNDEAALEAYGEPQEVTEAQVGFPIHVQMEPLPLSISLGGSVKTTNLVIPKHIRTATFMFNNTIGGTVNDVDIVLTTPLNVNFGSPPEPRSGLFELAIFKAWNDFKNPSFLIEHTEPFDIKLLGVFYRVEV